MFSSNLTAASDIFISPCFLSCFPIPKANSRFNSSSACLYLLLSRISSFKSLIGIVATLCTVPRRYSLGYRELIEHCFILSTLHVISTSYLILIFYHVDIISFIYVLVLYGLTMCSNEILSNIVLLFNYLIIMLSILFTICLHYGSFAV